MSAVDFCQRFSVRVEFIRPSPHSLKGEISVSYLFIQKCWESSLLYPDQQKQQILLFLFKVVVSSVGLEFDPIANVRSPELDMWKEEQDIDAAIWPTIMYCCRKIKIYRFVWSPTYDMRKEKIDLQNLLICDIINSFYRFS